jgi:hypothetical protein
MEYPTPVSAVAAPLSASAIPIANSRKFILFIIFFLITYWTSSSMASIDLFVRS